jgi:NAD(P)-dependent dehydrogenase (short-subunit alcohol dehydrogenase family)
MERLVEKSILVTGAASGIGRASAIRLAAEGAKILASDVDEAGLAATCESISADGGTASAMICNVADPEQVDACVDAAVQRHGGLDALCNIAGVLHADIASDVSLKTWQRMIDINLTGTFLMCQAALPHLVETKGAIVNMASIAGLSGQPFSLAYAASKGGVLALTYTLAVEYGKRGLRINAICPGDITSGMTENFVFPEGADLKLLYRVMSLTGARPPEAVAGVVAMLVSEDGIHINGEYIRVDGGTRA